MQATVFSIYMQNIAEEVREAQRSVVERFLPSGWDFVQYKEPGQSHPAAMTICVRENKKPLTIFLDIDCIPLTQTALELLAVRAEIGMLVGAVQRANHISNSEHLYVGPFCMAFDNVHFAKAGQPTFFETARGDVAEEVTYAWRESEKPVYFLWPTHTAHPLWDLTSGKRFGLGTTYENLFYHEFCARVQQGNFIAKCEQVLSTATKVAHGD